MPSFADVRRFQIVGPWPRVQSSEMLFQYPILTLISVLHDVSSYRWVKEPVSGLCLGCICQAVSNCDRTLGCDGGVCGPFKITEPYWIDAHRPTVPLDDPRAEGAFEKCSTDPVCAAKTVKNYLLRFARDCNEDGVVDCADYADIHRLSGFSCHGHSDAGLRQTIEVCHLHVLDSTPSIDIR